MSKTIAYRTRLDVCGFDENERTRADLLRSTLNRPATRKVYVNVVSVSQSGLSRCMRLYVLNGSDLIDVTAIAARVLDYSMRNGCMVVRGCGMDMVWDTLRRLGERLYIDTRRDQHINYQIL